GEERFFGLFLAQAADLADDAFGLFRGQFAFFFFELLFELFPECLAVEVGEPFDVVELPGAAFFDQGDFDLLRVERAAFEFGVRGRLAAVHGDVRDFHRLRHFFALFGFFFAAFDRRLALFGAVLFDEALRLQFGAVAWIVRRRRRFDRFGDLVFGARAATAAAGGE